MLKAILSRIGAASQVAIPADIWLAAVSDLPFLTRLTTDELVRLRTLAEQLLSQKQMSGAGELELTAAIQVHIAIQACLPILNLGLGWYRGWSGIVVYPSEFLVPRRLHDEA